MISHSFCFADAAPKASLRSVYAASILFLPDGASCCRLPDMLLMISRMLPPHLRLSGLEHFHRSATASAVPAFHFTVSPASCLLLLLSIDDEADYARHAAPFYHADQPTLS